RAFREQYPAGQPSAPGRDAAESGGGGASPGALSDADSGAGLPGDAATRAGGGDDAGIDQPDQPGRSVKRRGASDRQQDRDKDRGTAHGTREQGSATGAGGFVAA